jgi:hypothetical protein
VSVRSWAVIPYVTTLRTREYLPAAARRVRTRAGLSLPQASASAPATAAVDIGGSECTPEVLERITGTRI